LRYLSSRHGIRYGWC